MWLLEILITDDERVECITTSPNAWERDTLGPWVPYHSLIALHALLEPVMVPWLPKLSLMLKKVDIT